MVMVGRNEPLAKRRLDLLEADRNEDGTFEYWVTPGAPRIAGAPVGASGRAPVCTLALVRGGRLEPDALVPALDLFHEHRASLAAEAGKSMMHCGPGGLGSHYPYFDYAWAAEAIAELPAEQQGRYRVGVLEVALSGRAEDGSFLDNPLIGRAVGTGFALGLFRSLGAGR